MSELSRFVYVKNCLTLPVKSNAKKVNSNDTGGGLGQVVF